MRIETPLGPFDFTTRDGVLTEAYFDHPLEGGDAKTAARLRAYFAGDVHALEGLPVDPQGTDFQKRVWKALLEIPCGKTWSYLQLAKRVGSHPRAVGGANGANPISLVIPCHRVIAHDGSLGGYGGGLGRKRWLIAHEKGQEQQELLPAAASRAASRGR